MQLWINIRIDGMTATAATHSVPFAKLICDSDGISCSCGPAIIFKATSVSIDFDQILTYSNYSQLTITHLTQTGN